MKRVRVGELKNNLSRYLEHVRAGETVIVLHRDRPVAKIVPMGTDADSEDEDARIVALERLGLARRGKGGMREWLKEHRPIKVAGGSLVQDLLEERRSGW
ncbi:MAG: type II toxin-antitoxin system Phd/YefM family antitoxin [Gammaproteobacteria bacterium]